MCWGHRTGYLWGDKVEPEQATKTAGARADRKVLTEERLGEGVLGKQGQEGERRHLVLVGEGTAWQQWVWGA